MWKERHAKLLLASRWSPFRLISRWNCLFLFEIVVSICESFWLFGNKTTDKRFIWWHCRIFVLHPPWPKSFESARAPHFKLVVIPTPLVRKEFLVYLSSSGSSRSVWFYFLINLCPTIGFHSSLFCKGAWRVFQIGWPHGNHETNEGRVIKANESQTLLVEI